MNRALRIGVLELQGDFYEHEAMLQRCGVQPVGVRRLAHLLDDRGEVLVDALVIPGGESTTIGMLLDELGMLEPVRQLVRPPHALPVLGTCAGCILLAREVKSEPQLKRIGCMDIEVQRNAYGSQVDSFECHVRSEQFADGEPLRAVHIRAPAITRLLQPESVRVLAAIEGRPVIVQQGNLLACTFHPELTTDTRVHQHFVAMVRARTRKAMPKST
ncbi:hypothetical protein CDCA_CDCA17G4371 [Cyanidium caldarium]|uniref:glutaminase n=1 Tax=Cyanidium caldarium TaxID=2771 RepID=A0AAV9J238_CYACA|nr:hypothetical protein CDCA_CDCA17G4371 [Cyanidium caldarium]